jgi:hypothetical protein
MSKTQDKRAARKAEAQAFVRARRQSQLQMFEHAYGVGLRMFEENKDKMSPEEIEVIEKMKIEQLETLERLKREAHQDSEA